MIPSWSCCWSEYSSLSSDTIIISSPDPLPSYLEIADAEFARQQIAEQIELAIKRAKTSTLSCLEVLIPLNLTSQVAQDVLSSSETEPCGLRGCILYISLENEHKELQRIAVIRPAGCNAVATFELFLTLKQANTGWLASVSTKVLKTLGRKSIVINESYQLSKKKLFRSDFSWEEKERQVIHPFLSLLLHLRSSLTSFPFFLHSPPSLLSSSHPFFRHLLLQLQP